MLLELSLLLKIIIIITLVIADWNICDETWSDASENTIVPQAIYDNIWIIF